MVLFSFGKRKRREGEEKERKQEKQECTDSSSYGLWTRDFHFVKESVLPELKANRLRQFGRDSADLEDTALQGEGSIGKSKRIPS